MLTRYLYLLVALLVPSSVSASDPVELSTFIALPRPAPTLEIPYGANSSQAIDVFLPDGPGPHPVAILIHGGCWKDIPGAGREQLRHLGPELTRQGIAVWSIGYRRADEPGGGYPARSTMWQRLSTASNRRQTGFTWIFHGQFWWATRLVDTWPSGRRRGGIFWRPVLSIIQRRSCRATSLASLALAI